MPPAAPVIAGIVQAVAAHAAANERPTPKLIGISPQQELALAALARGKGPVEAAEEAGVDRSTLYRWRMYDPDFIAALNRIRRQTCDVAIDCIAQVTARAAQIVVEAIEKGNLRTALMFCKEVGLFKAALADGPRTPDAVHQTKERDDLRQEVALLEERMTLLSKQAAHAGSNLGRVIVEPRRRLRRSRSRDPRHIAAKHEPRPL